MYLLLSGAAGFTISAIDADGRRSMFNEWVTEYTIGLQQFHPTVSASRRLYPTTISHIPNSRKPYCVHIWQGAGG